MVLWMVFIIWGGFVLVLWVYKYMVSLCEMEDKLYYDYQMVLEGCKELIFNCECVEYVFNQFYFLDVREYWYYIVCVDIFYFSVVNWLNIMMFGVIGLVFWMVNSFGWVDIVVVVIYFLMLLFLCMLLFFVVGVLFMLFSVQVVFNKFCQFFFVLYWVDFFWLQVYFDWQMLELCDVIFYYLDQCFVVGLFNLMLKCGELVFLIGGNGSGKLMLVMFLIGLYQLIFGQIFVDGQLLVVERLEEYCKLFFVVFIDVWLFDCLFGLQGEEVDLVLVVIWLECL